MSDVFWQALIAGAVTLILAWMQQRSHTVAKEALVNAKDTKLSVVSALASTDGKLDENTKVTKETKKEMDKVVVQTNGSLQNLKDLLVKSAIAVAERDETIRLLRVRLEEMALRLERRE